MLEVELVDGEWKGRYFSFSRRRYFYSHYYDQVHVLSPR